VANQIAIVSILPFRSLNSAWNTNMRGTFHLTCWMHVAVDDVGCIFTFFARPSFSKWPFWLQPLGLSSEGRRYPQNFWLHKQCNVQLCATKTEKLCAFNNHSAAKNTIFL
jgi:hypothetical protein